ncbi:DNA helicase [Arthrobacter phage Supakev]|nr:DNA helicase [Arthrobacter phage Supakev]
MDPDREKGPLRRRAWPRQISSSHRSVRWAKQSKRDHRSGDGDQRRHMAGPTGPVVRVSGELDCYSVFGNEPPREDGQRRIETYIKTGPGAYRVVSRLGSGRVPLYERTLDVLDEIRRGSGEELGARPRNDWDADSELGARDVYAAPRDPSEGRQEGWPTGVVLEVGGDVVRRGGEPVPGAREGDRATPGLSAGVLRPPGDSALRTLYELHGREPRGPFFETASGRLLGPASGDDPGNRGSYGWTPAEALPRDEETLHDRGRGQGDSELVERSQERLARQDQYISLAAEPRRGAEGWEIRTAEIRPRGTSKTYLGLSALSGCCGGVCGCSPISGGYRCFCSRWKYEAGQWSCCPGFQGWEARCAGGITGDGGGRAAAYGRGYGDLCRDFLQAVSERTGPPTGAPARADSPGDYQGLYNSGYRRCKQADPVGREDSRPNSFYVGGRLQEDAVRSSVYRWFIDHPRDPVGTLAASLA